MRNRLADIIDIPRLQKLADSFYAATGFPSTVVDQDGNSLVEAGYQRICTFYHRQNPNTRQHCVEMDPGQACQLFVSEPGILHRCHNGLSYAAVPIIVGDEVIGGVITGQLLFTPPDWTFFRSQALQNQFDEDDYVQAVAEVPVLDAARMPAVLEFLTGYANLLAELGMRAQKQLEEQADLEQRERAYQLFAKNVADVIWRLDLKTMRFTYISPSITQMRGYTVEEAMAFSMAESLDAESLERVNSELPGRLERFLRNDPNARVQTDVFRQPCKDGSWIWVEVISTFIKNEAGEVDEIIGMTRDISARRQAEEELKANRERLEMALRGGNLGSFDANFKTGLTYFDDRWAEILGFQPGELKPGDHVWAGLVVPEDRVRVDAALESCLQGTLPFYEVEYRMRTKSGEIRWISARGKVMERDASGKALRFSGTHQDITERKNAEDRLRRMAQRLENLHEIDHAILSVVPLPDICTELLVRLHSQLACQRADIIFTKPDGQGELVLSIDAAGSLKVDPLVEKFSQWEEVDPESSTPDYQLIQDLQLVRTTDPLLLSLQAAGLRSFLAIRLIAAGQRYGSLHLAAQEPNFFSNEDIEMALELAAELAMAMQQARLREEVARRAMELENRVAARTSQLQTANKELETFAYSVSHDLKTPLRGIEGYTRLMLEEYSGQLDGQATAYLDHIQRASVKMSQLIDDLLKYSRLERRLKVIHQANIPEMIQSILQERDEEISRRSVSVQLNLQCDSVTVEIVGLQQALGNLVDNALKFTQSIQNPILEIGALEKGEKCLIWVRDNGIGFEMIYHNRIFNVFERLHRDDDYPGTGIGLAIVRKAMERMGGKVWAESAPGKGSVFTLEFPRLQV